MPLILMEKSHASTSAVRNANDSVKQPSAAEEQQTCSASGVDTVHELGNLLRNTLQVKDENYLALSDLPSDEDSSSSLEDENMTGDCDINLDGSVENSSKCLQKCATFPVTVSAEKTPDTQSENNSYARSLSLPTADKLVSAMKGGREKEGLPLKKLSVSWAPDVYDPPPTSLSHYPKKKVQQHYKNNKKHGKGKQKAKNMRGGGSCPKDKKHYRKIGGKSERCLDSFADTDRVMSSNKYRSSVDLLDFDDVDDDIGGHESNCGSSFRGKAANAMHYAYAEAT